MTVYCMPTLLIAERTIVGFSLTGTIALSSCVGRHTINSQASYYKALQILTVNHKKTTTVRLAKILKQNYHI